MNGLFEACNDKIIPYFTEPKLFHKVLQNVFIFCLITRRALLESVSITALHQMLWRGWWKVKNRTSQKEAEQ
jgi:hypothetical protein